MTYQKNSQAEPQAAPKTVELPGIIPDQIEGLLKLSEEAFLKKCSSKNYQASGPGGQKRNRVQSAIRLELKNSGCFVTASEYREPYRNLKSAVQKLRLKLALLPVQYIAGPETPAYTEWLREWKSLDESKKPELPAVFIFVFRKNISTSHEDYPLQVFISLMLLIQAKGLIKALSPVLGDTSSAITGFFKSDKHVWQAVQSIRTYFNLGNLK